ncbi:MAG: hypothetical protein WDZ85_02960 [Candidatus Paceibacterota bacterium]
MIDLTLSLIGITILFVIFIALRSVFSLKVCALCGAVSVAWLTLIVFFYAGDEINPVLIGLLMGGSIVGGMYLLEQKLPAKYQLFKLPYFLTLVSVAYFILTKKIITEAVFVLLLVWFSFSLIYLGGRAEKLKFVGRKIIECCKNW